VKMVVLDPLAEIDRAGFGIGARHIGALSDLADIAELLALHIAVEERQPRHTPGLIAQDDRAWRAIVPCTLSQLIRVGS
jgi:hypothetical protein